MNNRRVRTKNNGGKKDITLMTLLANESTADARNLLKKYNKPDALNTGDLEVKLAELYYSAPDKIVLEKDMAEIHPHKKWLLKYIAPPIEEAQKDIKQIEKGNDTILSNADGGCGCGNPNCPYNKTSSACGCSHFDSATTPSPQVVTPSTQYTPMDYMGILGMFAIVGLTFYVVTKR
tara:strand:- start:1347 stop:1877 length:531 start_codon:yes stop_codon:yes gene_type:complete